MTRGWTRGVLRQRRVRAGWAPTARPHGDGGDAEPASAGSAGQARPCGDDGNAVLEFIGASLLLIVPVVYLVLVLAAVQAATFAVDGAAREAARAVVTGPPHGEQRAVAAVALAFDDQGLDPATAEDALTVLCDPDCTSAGSRVTVEVETEVDLPGVPGFLSGVVPVSVPVGARLTAPVDDFRAPDGAP
ncbi:pilus assembly protein [Actinotalea sp. AC32]|nr:pilus assembly protein [Actinotalea sp. AC32]